MPLGLMDDLSDVALIEAVVRDDPGAFREFLGRYGGLVRLWVTRILAAHGLPADGADDVFQEVMVALVRDGYARLRRWDRRGTLPGFLKVTIRNLTLNVLRGQTVFSNLEKPAARGRYEASIREVTLSAGGALRPDEWVAREETLRHRKRQLLDSLTASETLCYRLLYERDLSPSEVAGVMGTTANNVHQTRHRIKRKLLTLLDRERSQEYGPHGHA